MLLILKEQQLLLDQRHFFQKMSSFLLSRSMNPNMLKALKDRELLNRLWLPVWEQFNQESEYLLATMFTYVLARYCEDGMDDHYTNSYVPSLRAAFLGGNAEVYMQRYYSDLGYIRLCEFELESEHV